MAQVKSINHQKKIINILIVDDHKLLRQGLIKMLSSLRKELPLKIYEADSGRKALLKIHQKEIDLIIIDYQMPEMSGLETIRQILQLKPKMKIVTLSNYDELAFVESMRNMGVKGYLLKNIESDDLHKAIKVILAGGKYFSSEIALKLLDASERDQSRQLLCKETLSRREIQILQMIAMELTNEEISAKLLISKRTIDTHRQNLLNKLHVKNTVGLIKAAYKMDLVKD